MRRALIVALAACTALAVVAFAPATSTGHKAKVAPTKYVVVYEQGVSKSAARAAIRSAGARVVRVNDKIGVATVVSSNPNFILDATASKLIVGAARNIPIGRAQPGKGKAAPTKFREEFLPDVRNALRGKKLKRTSSLKLSSHSGGVEPLAHHQWDMQQIHATAAGSYRKERGNKRVLVGILDTGVDGNHPDIAPNFNRSLSRNFTVDIPTDPLSGEEIDGPCADEPDASCNDPNNVDENSHGTHVASTVASPINGIGMAGVAPGVQIVNIRAGQDSGFFFLQASVDALTYAGDIGIDVVNMSYFIDPYLYNCRGLPGDSPSEQAEQATILEGAQRALDYAHSHGVTLVGAAGNGLTDITMPKPVTDTQSPNFPLHQNHPRAVNNGCLDLPTEGNNVISVSSVGKTKTKADYSNYGYGEIDVAAPGGYSRDDPWSLSMTPAERAAAVIPNLILAAYPESVGRASGAIDAAGNPTTASVVKSCKGSTCAYYQWIQGTSMASPHAAGVAALIVSRYGDRRNNGITLDPHFTRAYLVATATETPCMTPNPYSYTHKGRSTAYTTWCEGTPTYNGVYGHGIVDALSAINYSGSNNDDDDD